MSLDLSQRREGKINEMMMLLGLDRQHRYRDYVARLMEAGETLPSIREILRTTSEPPHA